MSSTNPDLAFVLASRTDSSAPRSQKFRLPNPQHSCINGVRIRTCTACAGAPQNQRTGGPPCERCRGAGFVGSKCRICAQAGELAIEQLVDMARKTRKEDGEKQDEAVERRGDEALEMAMSSSTVRSSSPPNE
ncbi:hypothetical protein MBLNU459_g0766t1 [Dothideomycetes sp. NU459]